MAQLAKSELAKTSEPLCLSKWINILKLQKCILETLIRLIAAIDHHPHPPETRREKVLKLLTATICQSLGSGHLQGG